EVHRERPHEPRLVVERQPRDDAPHAGEITLARRLAHLFLDVVERLSLLLEDHLPEELAEQPDVAPERTLRVCRGRRRRHPAIVGRRPVLFVSGMPTHDQGFFGHPRGLSTLFFTELWERFSYYGMRAILILFMTAAPATGGLGYDTGTAGAVYGLYTSMVYMMSLPGGWVADRLIGQQAAVLWGGILSMCGHFSIALPHIGTFYFGLLLIVLGTGLLKPNVSAIVGQIYAPDDVRRDAGFSIFYMGINIGGFTAPLVCGYLGQRVDWHWGFGAAGIGMAVGLIQYQ